MIFPRLTSVRAPSLVLVLGPNFVHDHGKSRLPSDRQPPDGKTSGGKIRVQMSFFSCFLTELSSIRVHCLFCRFCHSICGPWKTPLHVAMKESLS